MAVAAADCRCSQFVLKRCKHIARLSVARVAGSGLFAAGGIRFYAVQGGTLETSVSYHGRYQA